MNCLSKIEIGWISPYPIELIEIEVKYNAVLYASNQGYLFGLSSVLWFSISLNLFLKI